MVDRISAAAQRCPPTVSCPFVPTRPSQRGAHPKRHRDGDSDVSPTDPARPANSQVRLRSSTANPAAIDPATSSRWTDRTPSGSVRNLSRGRPIPSGMRFVVFGANTRSCAYRRPQRGDAQDVDRHYITVITKMSMGGRGISLNSTRGLWWCVRSSFRWSLGVAVPRTRGWVTPCRRAEPSRTDGAAERPARGHPVVWWSCRKLGATGTSGRGSTQGLTASGVALHRYTAPNPQARPPTSPTILMPLHPTSDILCPTRAPTSRVCSPLCGSEEDDVVDFVGIDRRIGGWPVVQLLTITVGATALTLGATSAPGQPGPTLGEPPPDECRPGAS